MFLLFDFKPIFNLKGMNKKYKASSVRNRERKSVRHLERFSKQEKAEQNKTSKHQHTHPPTMISSFIYFNLVDSNALKQKILQTLKNVHLL